jgi:hypothetical protein
MSMQVEKGWHDDNARAETRELLHVLYICGKPNWNRGCTKVAPLVATSSAWTTCFTPTRNNKRHLPRFATRHSVIARASLALESRVGLGRRGIRLYSSNWKLLTTYHPSYHASDEPPTASMCTPGELATGSMTMLCFSVSPRLSLSRRRFSIVFTVAYSTPSLLRYTVKGDGLSTS